jgi:hypothetical protein
VSVYSGKVRIGLEGLLLLTPSATPPLLGSHFFRVGGCFQCQYGIGRGLQTLPCSTSGYATEYFDEDEGLL